MEDVKPTRIAGLGEPEPVSPEIPADAQQPPPPPTVRRFPVAVYFIAYVAETGKGRKFGNQIIKSPKQLSTTQEMRTIETIISNALPATHGIVGNKPVVTIQCITNLGTMLVEETTTEEGAKADEAGDGPTDPTIADQPS